jgi:rsbT antagonist protein RsbS
MERIPVLRMGTLLLITIQVDMHDKLAMQLQDDVTQRISEWGSTGVLIDISSLEIVDSFIGRMLANIAAMSRNVTSRGSDGTERGSGNGTAVWGGRTELWIR